MAARAKQRVEPVPTDRGEPADRVLVLTRLFDAPPSLLFEACTQGRHLARWCAPNGFTVTSSEGDLRPGGHWGAVMAGPDGREYRLSGVYREIIEDKLVVFTHAWEDERGLRGHETLVTMHFAAKGDKTELTLRQGVFPSVAARDGHRGGWSECLERLAAHLAEAA